MVAKQWFDHDRNSYTFIKNITDHSPIAFAHADDFDENGLFYWIGTNAKTAGEWANPAQVLLVIRGPAIFFKIPL